jgi:xanthine dehydrogenase molybdopterin-binding subunit B
VLISLVNLLLLLLLLLLLSGDVSAALSSAARVLTGQVKAGAQRHFYMVRAERIDTVPACVASCKDTY